MTGVFGVLNANGRPVERVQYEPLIDAMSLWGTSRTLLMSDSAGMAGVFDADGDDPVPCVRRLGPIVVAVVARLTNRVELAGRLDLPTSTGHSDSELVLAAYGAWGADCVRHLQGEWSFAAWQTQSRTLTLARSRFGESPLFYAIGDGTVLFGSSLRILASVPGIAQKPDDIFVAQTLVAGWFPTGDRTSLEAVRRVPPASIVTIADGRAAVRQYWNVDAIKAARYSDAREVAEGLTEVFGSAVRDALRGVKKAGILLSAGLDSGATLAMAAPVLRAQATPLIAFTAVPRHQVTLAGAMADEGPLARATAAMHDVPHSCEPSDRSPVTALVESCCIKGRPSFAGSNQYWLLDLFARSRAEGVTTLLTGSHGNLTISWPGNPLSMPLLQLLRRRRYRRAAYASVPSAIRGVLDGYRDRDAPSRAVRNSAISDQFSRSLAVVDRLEDEGFTRRPQRWSGDWRVSPLWSLHQEMSESAGANHVCLRDPTCDERVVDFCLAIPEKWHFSAEGIGRWPLRLAMASRLPAAVVYARQRGRQAADIIPRLREDRAAIEAAIAVCDRTAAVRERIDMPRVQAAFEQILVRDDPEAQQLADAVLLRGLSCGLFLHRLTAPTSA